MRWLITALLLLCAPAAAAAQPHVSAVASDPPLDRAHRAGMSSLRIPSHGAQMNAVFYLAGGAGAHPTVLLLHGSPGNEQNLDLAQAIRRSGWNVLTFHYRGSWGSQGTYSIANSLEDARLVLAFLRDPQTVRRYNLQPGRIVIIGHSMGGFIAAKLGSQDPLLAGVGLLAAWDVGHDAPLMAHMSPAAYEEEFSDLPGRVVGATGHSMVREALAHQRDWSFLSMADGLSHRNVLIITPHDEDRPQSILLADRLRANGASPQFHDLDTDHPFSDARIALETLVLAWLGSLPDPAR
jgi:pimeloyl-ACP methyl ester carboxylesterase